MESEVRAAKAVPQIGSWTGGDVIFSTHKNRRHTHAGPTFNACVATLLTLAGTSTAVGQANFSTEETDPRPKHFGSKPTSSGVDHVDPHSGNLTIRHRELVLQGNGGMDITVWRVYDMASQSGGLSATHSKSYRWAAMGPGWKVAAAPRLWHNNNYFPSSSGVIYFNSPLLRLCGGQHLFHSSIGSPSLLLELADGGQEPLYSVGGYRAVTKSNWKVECIGNVVTATAPEGTVYQFGNVTTDRVIGLYEIDIRGSTEEGPAPTRSETYMVAKTATDLAGNVLTFSYQQRGTAIASSPVPGVPHGYHGSNMESPALMLLRIDANDGRFASFAHNQTTGRLESITDHTGRSWTYGYQPSSDQNAHALSRVTLPGGARWLYDYAPGGYLIAGEGGTTIPLNQTTITSRKLTRLTYPSGGTVGYEYEFFNLSAGISNSSGWDTMYSRGERVTRRTLSTGESWSYAYTRGGLGQYDATTKAGPEGTTTWRHMGPGYSIWTVYGYPPSQYQNNAWRVGRLMESVGPTGETEINVWQSREILSTDTRISELGVVYDQRIWAADLQRKTVVRDGVTYTTEYFDYDAYGNVGRIVESASDGSRRTTVRTYDVDVPRNILHRVKDESVTINAIAGPNGPVNCTANPAACH